MTRKLTFSFDVGTNSLGSAVVNNSDKKILHAGVTIFPMGVKLQKGTKEESRNLTRRLKRQGRRQNFRSKMRKELLAKELIKHKMFPDIEKLYKKYVNGKAKHFREKWEKVIRMTPLPEELQAYFHTNPYEIRHRAAKEEKLSLYDLGRALYHFAQRRGYKESLQEDNDDKGAIYEGDPAAEKSGINETKELVNTYGTLGNALYHQNPHENRYRNRYTLRSMYHTEFETVFRGQQPYYPDLLTEDLYHKMGGVHPTDSTESGILFFQRPLRSMKHLIGKCTFEPNKPKAPVATFTFEKFRALQLINNIRFNREPLAKSEIDLLLDYVLKLKSKVKFEALAKKLKKPVEDFNYAPKDSIAASPIHANFLSIFKKKWNTFSEKQREDLWHLKYWARTPEWLENKLEQDFGLDEKEIEAFKKFKMTKEYASLSRKALNSILIFLERGYRYDSAVLLAGVRNALKPDFFDKLPLVKQAEIENDVLREANNRSKETNSIDRVKKLLTEGYGVDEKSLNKLYHHSMEQEGGGNLKYLPKPEDLKNPIVMKALFELRKIYNALVGEFGEPDVVRIELARELKTNKENRAKIRSRQQELETENDRIKERLDEYGVPHSSANIQKLKLLTEIENRSGRMANPFWPDRNFNVNKSFFGDGSVQVEHIVPYSVSMNDSLANKTLCDADTNQLKGNLTPYEYFQKHRPEEWEEVKDRIFKILPYQKAKRFVSEKNIDAEDFISRQLNDTRYISSKAVAYLKQACKQVEITEGSVVSMLRYYWGLDGILSPYYNLNAPDGEYLAALDTDDAIVSHRIYHPKTKKKDSETLAKMGELLHGQVKDGKFYLIKQRADHRHHALDAIVTAFASRFYLQKVSTMLGSGLEKKDIKYNKDHQLEKPWERFRTDVRKAIDHLLIHHSQENKVLVKVKKKRYTPDGMPLKQNGNQMYAIGMAARGQLHEESIFGKHTDSTGETYYHIRKPIDHVKGYKQWRNIVSPRVQQAIYERLKELYPEQKLVDGELPEKWALSDLVKEDQQNVFFITHEDKTRKPMILLSNKNGEPIPVKKVRTKERIKDAPQLKEGVNQHVKSGNNHHCLVYEDTNGKIQFEFASFWTVVERKKQKQELFQMPQDGVMIKNIFINNNELYILGLSDEDFESFYKNHEYNQLSHHLYRVQKMSTSGYRVQFRKHTATTLNNLNDWKGFSSSNGYFELNPIAVSVNELGKIERR